MATITKPTAFKIARATAHHRAHTAMAISPTNGTQQVYVYAAPLRVIDLSIPPIEESVAAEWTQFIRELNGFENTFNMEIAALQKIFPDETFSSPVAFRLMEKDTPWSVDTALHYGFNFVAFEAR